MTDILVAESNQELRDDRTLDYIQNTVPEPLVILDFEQTGGRVEIEELPTSGTNTDVDELKVVNQEPK